MRTSRQILAAISVAVLAVAGGTAFTGTGLTNDAGSSQFIGGTVSQTVNGGTLTAVDYSFTDTSHTTVSMIDVSVTVTGSQMQGILLVPQGTGVGSFSCQWFTLSRPANGERSGVSRCAYVPPDGSDATGYTGLTSVDITVGSPG